MVNLQRSFILKRTIDYALLLTRSVIFETVQCLAGRVEKEKIISESNIFVEFSKDLILRES